MNRIMLWLIEPSPLRLQFSKGKAPLTQGVYQSRHGIHVNPLSFSDSAPTF